jgi:hypothetical protein
MTRRILQTICIPVAALAVAFPGAGDAAGWSSSAVAGSAKHPQLTWARIGRKPLSDGKAAALVTREPENRPSNQAANRYRPTNRELQVFRTARDHFHLTPVQENPLNAYVTGRSMLHRPATDMIIQWAAHKWGIPEDMLRATAWFEAGWYMNHPGDLAVVPASWYTKYPPQLRSTNGMVWQSMGTMQIKWKPDGSTHAGTQRLRWISTAFNLDYAAATIRYYYDGKCRWCGRGYHAGQQWNSVGAWNRPVPWDNARAQWYIGKVKGALAMRGWTRPGR